MDGVIVAPLEIAATRAARGRGLLGRSGIDGALLLGPAGSVHTFGMRFAIDLALCTTDLEVVAIHSLGPGRLTWPRRQVRSVIEAEAGALERWGITAGTRLAIVSEPIGTPEVGRRRP